MIPSSFINPFSQKTWNLTEQAKIYRDRPEIVERLIDDAMEEEAKRLKRVEWLKDQIQHLQKELDSLSLKAGQKTLDYNWLKKITGTYPKA